VLPHLKTLRASGMSQTQIARQASISQAAISYITTGRTKTVQADKARRILAVQPRHFDGNSERPAIGSIRRIRALYSLGHSRADIAALSGLCVASISLLAEGRWKVIDNKAAVGIAKAYRQLAHQRGRNWKNKRRAAAENWHGPLAWDDIDDPNCEPETEQDARVPNFHQRAQLRREEIEHLAAFGYKPEQIRARLNNEVSISTVRAIVHEWHTSQRRGRTQPERSAA
jgi:transcriptional regulator with XRE-family HTH domain